MLHLNEENAFGRVSSDVVMSACSLKLCGNLGAVRKSEEIYVEIARIGWL